MDLERSKRWPVSWRGYRKRDPRGGSLVVGSRRGTLGECQKKWACIGFTKCYCCAASDINTVLHFS